MKQQHKVALKDWQISFLLRSVRQELPFIYKFGVTIIGRQDWIILILSASVFLFEGKNRSPLDTL